MEPHGWQQPPPGAYASPSAPYASGYAQQPQAPSPASAPPHLSAPPGAYGSPYAPPYGGYAPPGGSPSAGYGLEAAVVTYPTLPAFSSRDAAPPPPRQAPSYGAPPPARRNEFAPEEPGGPQGAARFKVILLPSDDGGDILDVVAQVGLDGVKLLDAARRSTLRVYPLECISRWTVRDSTMLCFHARLAGDEAERQVALSSDERTTRSLLDVLACSCLQLCELRGIDAGDMMDAMGSGAGTNKLFAASSAAAAAAAAAAASPGGRATRTADPGAAAVEYWRAPEHSGWLYKKGEHLSTWRRRWFVLKEGRLFWFLSDKVTPAVKPRGFIPLKACPGARAATLTEAGKPYALELQGPDALAAGCRHLGADSEAEKDKWVTAISRAAAAASSAAASPAGGSRSHEEWAAQLREGMQALSSVSPRAPAPVVEVASYSGGSGGGSVSYSSYDDSRSASYGGGSSGGGGSGWQVHYNEAGRAFYYQPSTGRTQWDPPPGFG